MVVQGKTRKTATKTDTPRPSPVSRIDKIASLKRYPDKDYALDLLHQMARAVAPIIHEYKFKVGTLCEMYPKNACLLGLNVNRGQKILIRLRPAHNDRTFLPMGDLIGTFLHELTHNVHGPHDARFYALLDELRQKYETGAFLAKDYVCEENALGAGFQAPWATPQSMRQKRIEALSKGKYKAEARRVGGKAPPTGDLRKAMLEAAERRLKDAKWCSHGSDTEVPESGDLEIIELDDEPLIRKKPQFSAGNSDNRDNKMSDTEKYREIIDLTSEGISDNDEKDDIEIITVHACEQNQEPDSPRGLRPSLLEQQTFSTSSGHFEMRSTIRYFISSSPGRTFIGDGSASIRRKVVADLNFDHIIDSTSYIEMPQPRDQSTSLQQAITTDKEVLEAKSNGNTKARTKTKTKKAKTTKDTKKLNKSERTLSNEQALLVTQSTASASTMRKREKREKKADKARTVKHEQKKRARKEVRCVSFQELFLS